MLLIFATGPMGFTVEIEASVKGFVIKDSLYVDCPYSSF